MRRKSRVTFVTNQPFNSDFFNDYYAALAGEKILKPIILDFAGDNTLYIIGGSFIDHRGIKFDFSVGEPTSVDLPTDGKIWGIVVFYDKTKPLNFDVTLRIEKFDDIESVKKYKSEDPQECLLLAVDAVNKEVVYDLPELGKEYLKDIESIDNQIKEAIEDEIEGIINQQGENAVKIEDLESVTKVIENNIKNIEETLKSKVDRIAIGLTKADKDPDNSTFKIVEKTDDAGKVVSRSVLSEPDSEGRFTKRKVTLYVGTPFEKTYDLKLSYDEDGDLISEKLI